MKVPKDLPLEMLAPLGCGLQTGAGTVMNSLAVPAGASIAIFGTGGVGLAAVMAARIVGANPIIGVDRVPSRLKLAMELGATHVIDTRHEGVTDGIRAATGGGVDYVVESTGDSRLYRLAVVLLNPKGTAAYIAGENGPSSLPGGRRALSIVQGDAVPQVFIPRLIELLSGRALPVGPHREILRLRADQPGHRRCPVRPRHQARPAGKRSVGRNQEGKLTIFPCLRGGIS